MNKVKTLTNLRVVAFEGGDLSGKTTQAVEFAKSVPFAILVHFPRVKPIGTELSGLFNDLKNPREIIGFTNFNSIIENTKKAFRETEKFLYDEVFWKELFNEIEQNLKKADPNTPEKRVALENINKTKYIDDVVKQITTGYYFEKLTECCMNNVLANGMDKKVFLDNFIINLVDNNKIDWEHHRDFLFNEDYRFFQNGMELTDRKEILVALDKHLDKYVGVMSQQGGKVDIKNFPTYLVLDRFSFSGFMYNALVPIETIILHIQMYYEYVQEPIHHAKTNHEAIFKKLFKLFCVDKGQSQYPFDMQKRENLIYKELVKKGKIHKDINPFVIIAFSRLIYSILSAQISVDASITERMNDMLDDRYSFVDYEKKSFYTKTVTTNPRFVNVLCYSTKNVKELMLKRAKDDGNRKYDKYDDLVFMQGVINQWIETFKTHVFNVNATITDDIEGKVPSILNLSCFYKSPSLRQQMFMFVNNEDFISAKPNCNDKEVSDGIHRISKYIKENLEEYFDSDKTVEFVKNETTNKYIMRNVRY